MSLIFSKLFKKQNKVKSNNITGQDMCDIFYNLLYYYDKTSSNIAVIKNKKTFDWQVKVWKKKMNLKRGDTVNKLSNDRYLFIIDEQEINLVMLNNIPTDLYTGQIKFRRFMG